MTFTQNAPWKIVDRFDICLDDGDVQPLIATVNADNVNEEQADADARLIAAAPDLFEALTVAEATIERLNRHNSANGTLDVIRAALAKVSP